MPTMTRQRQQHGAFTELMGFLRVRFEEELGRRLTARVVYGCIDHDEGQPEQYAIKVFTGIGDQFLGTVRLISDAQSGWIEAASLPPDALIEQPAGAKNEPPTSSDLWALVRDG